MIVQFFSGLLLDAGIIPLQRYQEGHLSRDFFVVDDEGKSLPLSQQIVPVPLSSLRRGLGSVLPAGQGNPASADLKDRPATPLRCAVSHSHVF